MAADVAGQSKEAAEKAAKAAKEAADLAAAKTKETYDLLIPAQIDWSRTYWPQPMKDGIHALQNGIAKGVNTVADGASQGVSMAGSGLSSGLDMAGNAAGGLVSAVPGVPGGFTPRMPGGFGNTGNIETRSKDEISAWLSANKLEHLKDSFIKAEVDGAAMMGLMESWKKDPIGFASYAEKNLGCKAAGDAMKLGAAMNKIYSHAWTTVEKPAEAPAPAEPATGV